MFNMKFERYHFQLPYSYVFGAFGTIELLKNQKEKCLAILIDSSFCKNDAYDQILKLCENTSIEILIDDELIEKIKDKGNIFVIGVFKKYEQSLSHKPHILLSHINDVGQIGTIIRSMRGFNFENLVLIDCNIDLYDIHLIRSTMGAFFTIHMVSFSSLKNYLANYPNRNLINVYYGKSNDILKIKESFNDSLSLLFSKNPTHLKSIETYSFDKDIAFENMVNIILFQLYS